MDIDTTNINELPIIPNMPSNNQMEDIEKMNISSDNVMIDKEVDLAPNKKSVTFQDMVPEENNMNYDNEIKEEKYDLSLSMKIVILATLLFFFFMDPKIKKYLLNILVQIFGSYLKTDYGNFTQLGILIYSLFFGFVLTLILKSIDISSFHLAL